MDRRTFLASLMALGGWAALGGRSAAGEQAVLLAANLSAADRIAGWRERILLISGRGVLPMIDTEATYGRDISTKYMVDQMDKNGVALVCFAPNFNDPKRGSRFSLDMAAEHPDRFVPTTCDGTTDYWFRQEGPFLEVMQREARSGEFFLLGELEFRHYPSPAQYKAQKFWREITIPLRTGGCFAGSSGKDAGDLSWCQGDLVSCRAGPLPGQAIDLRPRVPGGDAVPASQPVLRPRSV